MVLAVWTDLKKLFGDYHIYFCMAGLGLVYVFVYMSCLNQTMYRFGITACYESIVDGSEIMLLSFMLCIVGGSFLYCAEEKYGYLSFEIQRIGVYKYTISKLLTSFIGGFSTYMVGALLFLCVEYVHQWVLFGAVSLEKENITALVWICLFAALRCGVLSVIGFLVSTYVPNYYIAMTLPLLLYYAMLQVEYWITVFLPVIPEQFFFSKVYMAGSIEGNDLSEFVFAMLYTACIMVIMYRMAKRCIERRLEHA